MQRGLPECASHSRFRSALIQFSSFIQLPLLGQPTPGQPRATIPKNQNVQKQAAPAVIIKHQTTNVVTHSFIHSLAKGSNAS